MPLVKKYRAIVSDIQNPISDVFILRMESNSGSFRYKPGQFLHLALDEYDPSGPWPESRCFSIQTSPDKDFIIITFARKGLFTQRMAKELHPGAEVWLKLPYGDLFSESDKQHDCVFIAGGTGVTPYLSLFSSPEFGNYKNPTLYFGVRNLKYHLYESSFLAAQKINPSLRIHILCEDTDGPLNIEAIYKNHTSLSIYFLSGPPAMSKTFKQQLMTFGVNENLVKTDEWE